VLVEPGRSQYDLNFRLLGFPVRVHPFFWLGALLLGADLLQGKFPAKIFVWIAVVFVSILVHEMGHALAFRLFGCRSYIVLYAFGGLAVPESVVRGRWRRILVALAGPFAGFILSATAFGSFFLVRWDQEYGPYVGFFFDALFFVNLYWGILNLIPVFPLDGGQVSRELCESRWHGRGQRISLQISVWVAISVAVYSVVCELESQSNKSLLDQLPWWFPRGSWYIAILFALLAYQSYQLLQQLGRGVYYEAPDDRLPWER
jgi:stage IV sporulation protein FB